MIKPIRPDEVQEKVNAEIPDFVIQAVNELIAKNWDGSSCTLLQKDIIERAEEILAEQIREKYRKNNQHGDYWLPEFNYDWLNFEELFRSVGWKVYYDKPGYCETYDASFKFEK